eukprot:EG_transcript_31782
MQFVKPDYSTVVLSDNGTKVACNEVGGDYQIARFSNVPAKASFTIHVSGFGFEIGEHSKDENGKLTHPVASTTPNPLVKASQVPLQTGRFAVEVNNGHCTIRAPDGETRSGTFSAEKAAVTLGGYVALQILDYQEG